MMNNFLSIKNAEKKISATEFLSKISSMSHTNREIEAVDAFLSGHTPERQKLLKEINVIVPIQQLIGKTTTVNLKLFVLQDYITIGNEDDFIRFPLNPMNAQIIADAVGCTFPTSKICDYIWGASKKLPPQPWGPPYNHEMMSLNRYKIHNERINTTIKNLKYDFSDLLCGHKKNVVLSPRLISRPKQVAIYGWHQANGKPIQPVSLIHENTYSDYAHGIRLVSNKCFINDDEYHLHELFEHEKFHKLVSSEGILKLFRQPLTKKV